MLNLVRLWIGISAGLVCAGWGLSAIHQLNQLGYVLVLLAGGISSAWCWHRLPGTNWPRVRRRFGWTAWRRLGGARKGGFGKRLWRGAPLLFLVLAVLALAAGILYPPPAGDASMYRTPRVLHWLADGHWHWLRTLDYRSNTRSFGFEWLSAPLLLFTRSDRWLFLINWASFLLLPGLLFSVFRRLGVSRKPAWWWTWLTASGLCYCLQASSPGNDAFVAVYALASVDLAFRARESGRLGDWWLSLIAAALVSGTKQTNIPLVLLWLIAAAPAWRLVLTRPWTTGVVGLVALLVSGVPNIYLNLAHGFTWAGLSRGGLAWDPWRHLVELQSPWWGIVGNTFYLPLMNLAPPFFVFHGGWNQCMRHFLGTPLGHHFASFELFGTLSSYPDEQKAGLGLMLCLLVVLSLFGVWRYRGDLRKQPLSASVRWLGVAPWGLLLLYMAKVGTWDGARLLAPYYPFLLLVLLQRQGLAALVQHRWWQRCALLAMAGSALWIVFAPYRPLWPDSTVFRHLQQVLPHSRALERAASFYSTCDIEAADRRIFHDAIPPDERVVGYATDIRGLEPALWRPFTRRVERVLPSDTEATWHELGLHYVVVDEYYLALTGWTLQEMLARYHLALVATHNQSEGWNRPERHVYLLRTTS